MRFAATLMLVASLARPGICDEPDRDSLARTTPEQLKFDESQFKFLAFFLTRGEATNIAPQNDLLQGRVVGRLFGPNTTNTGSTAWLLEQRLIPFFIFEPKILDRFARLRVSFEINWTWGEGAYGVGANFGSALSGRQINLQTQNVEVEFRLRPGWYLNVGLQRLWDNVRDPYRTFFNTVTLTGDRLAFWGSDAVGATVYGNTGRQLYKIGAYDLYHNKIDEDDHVLLFEVATERDVYRGWKIGGSARYLRDTSNRAGGVSTLLQGPDSDLADYDGAYRFPFNGAKYSANLGWLSLDTAYNPEFAAGRLGATAFLTASLGRLDVEDPATKRTYKAADVLGVAFDARIGYRWGKTRNDVITGEFLYTSGDQDGIKDGRYSGVITGNTYGTPAAAFVGTGTYLLFPHANVVNRFYAAVYDISNIGYGLAAGIINISGDFIPNVLTAKAGLAAGASNFAPPGGGHLIGVEANAMLAYRIKVFLSLELHAAYLRLGDFYDSPKTRPEGTTARPADPWTAFLALKWLLF
jgi:hypothetical protein